MLEKLVKALDHVNDKFGMPAATSYAVFAGYFVVSINDLVHLQGMAMTLMIILYIVSCFMVAWVGFEYDRLIAELNNETDWLKEKLGWYSWVIIYYIRGQEIRGTVEMTREQAEEFGIYSKSSGILKTKGLKKRYIPLR